MNILDDLNSKMQSVSQGIDELLNKCDSYKQELEKVKSENADIKNRMRLIHSEIEGYIEELRKIREYYVNSNNHH